MARSMLFEAIRRVIMKAQLKPTKKLKLNRETIRILDDRELRQARGGAGGSYSCYTWSGSCEGWDYGAGGFFGASI